jgi:mannose-6-phosphate isomerase-like protein (cupin superfamily)
MPTRKHLVLEDDVYEALVGRTQLSGLPIGRLGNAILRAHIGSALLESFVCHRLVEMGRVTEDEYRGVLDEAAQTLRRSFLPVSPPVDRGEGEELISGSWAIQNVYSPPEGAYQLLEVWAKDNLQRPMGQHAHAADEYVIGISGKTMFVMNGIPCTLRPGGIFQIPSGSVHSATPLGADSHLLVLVVPAVPEYDPITHPRNP